MSEFSLTLLRSIVYHLSISDRFPFLLLRCELLVRRSHLPAECQKAFPNFSVSIVVSKRLGLLDEYSLKCFDQANQSVKEYIPISAH